MKNLQIFLLVLLLTFSKNTEMELDPFKELGIPQISMSGDIQETKKDEIPKLETIDDLPAFVESAYFNTKAGVNMLTKFLTEDDDQLKENGGIFDQTGFDGLDKTEDIYPLNTEMRTKQRARSAVNLYTKQFDPESKYEAYGCIDEDEEKRKGKVQGWEMYTVLMMTPLGDHKMQAVCLPNDEKQNIVFVSANEVIDCADKAKVAKEIKDRTKKYFQKSGLGQKIMERLGIDIFEDTQSVDVVKTPPVKSTHNKVNNNTKNNNNNNGKNNNNNSNNYDNNKQDQVSELQKQIQELQNKLNKVVKNNNNQNQMRFKQQTNNQESSSQNSISNEQQQTQSVEKQQNKPQDTNTETNNDNQQLQNQDQQKIQLDDKNKNQIQQQQQVIKQESVQNQQDIILQMKQEFKKHDELMETQIKLLKEELDQMKNKKDQDFYRNRYQQQKQNDQEVKNGLVSMLQDKIKKK